MKLRFLEPETRFRVPSIGVEATLVSVNECGAAVRLGTTHVEFTAHRTGERVSFPRPGRVVYWSSDVDVEVLP